MATAAAPLKVKDYRSDAHNNWCPGCGDFGILTAIQSSFAKLQIPPHQVAVFSGIGCSGKTPHYIRTYGFHTLHGRVLPVATGAKVANRDLTVLAVGGDGDGYGIGAGYFVNAGRRNLDFTYIVFNNGVYGLTKGQAAPTLAKGLKTKSMPEPALQDSVNPIALAIGAGYTFIARGYALDVRRLSTLIADAIQHPGSAFIDVLQTCPTYNDLHTKEWYTQQNRLYQLSETGFDGTVHDPSNPDEVIEKKLQATAKSYEWGERIPLGVYYRVNSPTMDEEMASRRRDPDLSLVETDLTKRDIEPLLQKLRVSVDEDERSMSVS
jgi:2-oxoglutarate ferredoxin oxidoreductase subunit beta